MLVKEHCHASKLPKSSTNLHMQLRNQNVVSNYLNFQILKFWKNISANTFHQIK